MKRRERKKLVNETKRLLRDGGSFLKKKRKRLTESEWGELCQVLENLKKILKDKEITKVEWEEKLKQDLEKFRKFPDFKQKSIIREYIESILFAVFIALLIRTFLFEAFKIPTGSMIPTLQVDDHIFVNKFIYGIKIPFTNIRFFDYKKPQHGEIIVFKYPGKDEDAGKDFIKRVIGIPGDRVRLKNNILYINGLEVKSEIIKNHLPCNDSSLFNCFCVLQKETHGKYTYITQHRAPPPYNNPLECRNNEEWPLKYKEFGAPHYFGDKSNNPQWPEVLIPEGHYFVMGDNRDNSSDGRYWGLVPEENLKGKAFIIWWARDFSRLFKLIH